MRRVVMPATAGIHVLGHPPGKRRGWPGQTRPWRELRYALEFSSMFLRYLSLTFLALLALAPAARAADAWPSRPIHFVIPFPPGGSNDVVGRVFAAAIGEKLGQTLVVENRGGAGGVLGTELVSNAKPDGYTLLVISLAHAVNPWLYKLKYD